jgi:Fur family transcriptional regulator, peroxide stress response regulator
MLHETEGLGLTKQREAVLRVIRGSNTHMTANEVFDGARQILPAISFATVYNSLHFLKKAGLIGEVRFGMGAARYDRTMTRHDHAVCTQCEKLVDLELNIPEALLRSAAERSRFEPESIELTLRGLCPECSNK